MYDMSPTLVAFPVLYKSMKRSGGGWVEADYSLGAKRKGRGCWPALVATSSWQRRQGRPFSGREWSLCYYRLLRAVVSLEVPDAKRRAAVQRNSESGRVALQYSSYTAELSPRSSLLSLLSLLELAAPAAAGSGWSTSRLHMGQLRSTRSHSSTHLRW